MTEAEDWKRQMISLEDDNFDLYKRLQEVNNENARLKIALTNSRTSTNILLEAQQEGMEF